MKSLTTITGVETEYTPLTPAQRVTVGNVPTANRNFARSVVLTNDVVIVKRGSFAVNFKLSDLCSAAVRIEPGLTYAPVISTQPENDSAATGATSAFTVVASGEFDATYTLTYQWQVSSDSGATWTDLADDANYDDITTSYMGINDVTGLDGYLYRCLVTNDSGSTASNSATLTVT